MVNRPGGSILRQRASDRDRDKLMFRKGFWHSFLRPPGNARRIQLEVFVQVSASVPTSIRDVPNGRGLGGSRVSLWLRNRGPCGASSYQLTLVPRQAASIFRLL